MEAWGVDVIIHLLKGKKTKENIEVKGVYLRGNRSK